MAKILSFIGKYNPRAVRVMEKGTEEGKIGEQIQDIALLSQRDTASWNRLYRKLSFGIVQEGVDKRNSLSALSHLLYPGDTQSQSPSSNWSKRSPEL